MQDNSQDSVNPKLINRPFWFYFNRFKALTYSALLIVFVTNILDTMIPKLIGEAIDLVSENGGVTDPLIDKVLIILAVATLLAASRFSWRILWGNFHNKVAHHLRLTIFNKMIQHGSSFFQTRPVGQLMNLLIADVQAFRMGIGPGTLILFDGVFYLLIIPPMMYTISPSWTWKTMVLMPLMPFAMGKIMKWIQEGFRKQQDRFSELSGTSQEMVSGIRVIKSYAQEERQLKFFNRFSKKYQDACTNTAQKDALFSPVMNLGVTGGSVILLIVGAPEVISGEVTIGGFFAFYQYIQKMVWPVSALGMGNSMRSQARASFGRIKEILNHPIDIPDTGTESIEKFESISVENLSFKYPGEDKKVLDEVSFNLKSGEVLGIVGPTGAGKTTLVELLTRTYPTDSAKIKINNTPIEDLTLSNLRNNVCLIPQESFLFSASVSDNIRLDRAIDLDQIQQITDMVSITHEIDQMDRGYDSELGERGINLSGGQKQRLSMARALIRKSPVIIFDDTLSAVDANTEKSIVGELKKQVRSDDGVLRTSIIVSHRISSVSWADRILVLNEGRIESIGKHEELLEKSPIYKNLNLLQQEGDSNGS